MLTLEVRVVANAEGLATGVPLLKRIVAFFVANTELVELVFVACEKCRVSNERNQTWSFVVALRLRRKLNCVVHRGTFAFESRYIFSMQEVAGSPSFSVLRFIKCYLV
jgi:hypothetical protein